MMQQSKSVFISRELSPGSPFRSLLESEGWQVAGQSLINFKALPFELPPSLDWLFFYSKQGVKAFCEQLPARAWPGCRLAAIGPGTAQNLETYGHKPQFVGNGLPEATAKAFAEVAKGQLVAFVQARNSRQSVQRLLTRALNALSLIVYENEPKSDLLQQDAAVLVLTSPMNARAYFRQWPLLPGQQLVAIGQPTATALAELGLRAAMADEPTEVALAAAVLALSN